MTLSNVLDITEVKSKSCKKCKEIKSISEFSKDKLAKSGRTSDCKSCRNSRQKEYRAKNPEKVRKWNLKQYQKEKDNAQLEQREPRHTQRNYKSRLKRVYGLELYEYEQMLVNQNHCCRVCGVHEEKLTRRLSVDHCHASGKVRGLLCGSCNIALGCAKDDPEIFYALISYLEEFKGG